MSRQRTKNKGLPTNVYRKHGAYYLVVWNSETKKNRWHKLGRTEAEMYHALAEKFERKSSNLYPTMKAVFARYRREVLPTKAAKTAKEQAKQLCDLDTFFGTAPPEQVRSTHIYQFRDEGRASPVATNRKIALLSHVFTKAIEWGVLDSNPCKNVRKFSERPRTRYVTDAEFEAVAAIAPASIRLLMEFSYLTCMRLGDIRSLARQQVSEEGITYVAAKTQKHGNCATTVTWSPDLRAVVAEALSLHKKVARMHVFVTETGLVWSESGFTSAWSRLMDKALKLGVITEKFHFHDLRAKGASDRLSAEDARKALGHSNLQTTRIYRRAPEIVNPTR